VRLTNGDERSVKIVLVFFPQTPCIVHKPNTGYQARVAISQPNGIIVIVNAELDRLIHEKRSQLKNAFAAYQEASGAAACARMHLTRLVRGDGSDSTHITPDVLHDADVETQRLESEERVAATRLKAISDELAQLHREKYGEWHIRW
jgi:hypothetical protein